MSILDRFWARKPKLADGTAEGELLHDFVEAIETVGWPIPKIETWPEGRVILEQEPEIRARVVVLASQVVARKSRGLSSDQCEVLSALIRRLLRSKLPLDESRLTALALDLGGRRALEWGLPRILVIGAIERHAGEHGLSPALRAAVQKLQRKYDGRWAPRDMRRRLQRLLEGRERVLTSDAWGERVDAGVRAMPEAARGRWRALLAHATGAAGKARPTETWLRQAAPLVEAIGPGEVCATVADWLDGWTPGPAKKGPPYLGDANTDVLRGLLWAAAPAGDVDFAARVGALAEACFRKLRGHGPRATRLGNGCLVALGLVGGNRGIAELSRLEGRVRYANTRAMIASTLERAAEAAGLTRDDLEEIGVPGYGLDAGGRRRLPVGDGEAEIAIEGDKVALRWHLNGRATKGAPKALREAAPGAIKEARRTARELQATLSGQAGRIERFYLSDRVVPAPDWRRRYLEHPLVGTLARRLVWTLDLAGESRPILCWDGAPRDFEGRDVGGELDAEARIGLWHPVRSAAGEVRAIREQLIEREITQPFKQAHREVYLLTDAERDTGTYSNRFAAHVIRQHQFQALCQQRGWKYQLQGAFDSFNVPERRLPAWRLTVEFWVEPVDEPITEAGIFQYLTTDQVRFLRHGQQLELAEVPELAFSEAMRDVDLFTSVGSVGNDPNWRDRGDHPDAWNDYWTSFAFGELNATAETRREVLEGLLPRLKIADCCRLKKRWLEVRGDLRTYRIHLRSGHVMMEPNQQYLCIVADRSRGVRQRLYLPFEGDSTLSLILSKAFLLAADRKIDDPSILSQINA